MEYTVIFKLKEMLEEANIPFEYADNSFDLINRRYEHYQICYPANGEKRVCSIIEGNGTYGNQADLLEIMGLLTPVELQYNCVVGGLTANEVFDRINAHYTTHKGDIYGEKE